MTNAVLVIDMVRGFMDAQRPLYCGERGRRIIPNIQRLLGKEIKKGSRVFYLNDSHDPDDLHEVDGKPVAKRGRIPGITPNPLLKRIF